MIDIFKDSTFNLPKKHEISIESIACRFRKQELRKNLSRKLLKCEKAFSTEKCKQSSGYCN